MVAFGTWQQGRVYRDAVVSGWSRTWHPQGSESWPYVPRIPCSDDDAFAKSWRLVMRHTDHGVEVRWVAPGELVSGWVIGVRQEGV